MKPLQTETLTRYIVQERINGQWVDTETYLAESRARHELATQLIRHGAGKKLRVIRRTQIDTTI